MPARRVASTHRGCHITHVHPIAKGLACLCCRQRKVRCDGAMPACSTCIRSAKYEGKDASLVRCEYGRKKRMSSTDSATESEHEHNATPAIVPVPSVGPSILGLSDLTEEAAQTERDLQTLAALLQKQLDQSRPSTSKPAPQRSFDSGYSSDAYSTCSDSMYASTSAISGPNSPAFSFDDAAPSYFNFLTQPSAADAVLLPSTAAYSTPALIIPAFNFSESNSLASLPAYGDYFTQSPQDFNVSIPMEQDFSTDPSLFTADPSSWVAPLDLGAPLEQSASIDWEAWTALQGWTPLPN